GRSGDTRIQPIPLRRIGLRRGKASRDPYNLSFLLRTIYFDYNATTPLDPAVRESMLPYLGEIFGNPSSVHHVGRQARALLDDARDRAAQVLGSKPSEMIFTSGGTESANLVIFGVTRLKEV